MYLADFASLLHIRPWEWDLLTVTETYQLCAAIDAYREGLSD